MKCQIGKALVTGAGGFIGSHLVEALLCEGAEVTAFLHYNSRNDIGFLKQIDFPLLKRVRIFFGDLKDASAVLDAVKGQEVLFHLGALIGIPYSYQNPRDVIETNILGTLNILMAAKEVKVRRVLHTSSSEVYGTAQTQKIREEHPLQGQSPYSASKIGADKLVESFVASYKLPVVTIRPFNTYGPRQSMRAIIPAVISQALFQDEIHVGSVEPKRDFTYVQDTVHAFLLGATVEGAEGHVFNLGTGREVSVQEIIDKVFQLTGKPKPVRRTLERVRPKASEVFRLCSDYSRAKQFLGWEPRVSLDEGLQKAIQWIQNHPEAYSANHYVV